MYMYVLMAINSLHILPSSPKRSMEVSLSRPFSGNYYKQTAGPTDDIEETVNREVTLSIIRKSKLFAYFLFVDDWVCSCKIHKILASKRNIIFGSYSCIPISVIFLHETGTG